MQVQRQNETPAQAGDRKRKQISAMRQTRKQQACHIPSILEASTKFQNAVKLGPIYVCTCCHRLMYRHSVVERRADKPIQEVYKKIGKQI
jgi:hypothetical protein